MHADACSLKSVRGIFFQKKGGGKRAWRGRTDVILDSLRCAYIRKSGLSNRYLKMGAPWGTEDRAVLLRADATQSNTLPSVQQVEEGQETNRQRGPLPLLLVP